MTLCIVLCPVLFNPSAEFLGSTLINHFNSLACEKLSKLPKYIIRVSVLPAVPPKRYELNFISFSFVSSVASGGLENLIRLCNKSNLLKKMTEYV